MAQEMQHGGDDEAHAQPLVHGLDFALVEVEEHHHAGDADDDGRRRGQRRRVLLEQRVGIARRIGRLVRG